MMKRVRRLRIGGIHEDGLFGVLPSWVDGTKAPGTTSQTSELGFGTTMRNIVTLRYFFLSPNLVWFGMACGMHWFYPYAIDQATTNIITLPPRPPNYGRPDNQSLRRLWTGEAGRVPPGAQLKRRPVVALPLAASRSAAPWRPWDRAGR